MMKQRFQGFTLIELLTVIAIISILAAMTMIVGPGIIERAKLARLRNDLNQIRTALTQYSTQNRDSFPPAYGYIKWESRAKPKTSLQFTDEDFHLAPFMSFIGMFRQTEAYDEFSESYDANRNQQIDLLEFSPIGQKIGPDRYEWPTVLYTGPTSGDADVKTDMNRQLNESPRPFVYIPVNRKQAQKVAEYYYEVAKSNPLDGWYARVWDPDAPQLKDLKFPPPRYEDFVLISVGPVENTRGVLCDTPDELATLAAAGVAPADIYHVTALRAYFLATRDANGNGLLDFDYEARKKGEGKQASYASVGAGDLPLQLLPDDLEDGQGAKPGPIIYKP